MRRLIDSNLVVIKKNFKRAKKVNNCAKIGLKNDNNL